MCDDRTIADRVLVALLLVILTTACGGVRITRTADGPPAGTVLRVDPALDALVPNDYRIEKLAGDFVFTEGPVWVQRGSYLLFSDLRSNRIHRWDERSGLSTVMDSVFMGEYPPGSSVGSNAVSYKHLRAHET